MFCESYWDNEQQAGGRMTVKYHLFEQYAYLFAVKISSFFPEKCLFCMIQAILPHGNFHGGVWLSCQLISGSYLPILNYFWLLICSKDFADGEMTEINRKLSVFGLVMLDLVNWKLSFGFTIEMGICQ